MNKSICCPSIWGEHPAWPRQYTRCSMALRISSKIPTCTGLWTSRFTRELGLTNSIALLVLARGEQSLNLYAYVRNNSPSMTDPSGLQCDGFDSDCCDICIPSIDIGIGI